MKLFKKQSEMENLQEQKQEIGKKVSELQSKKTKLTNALNLINAELMVEETASVKKKADKFNKAIKDIDKEIEGLNKEATEVNSQLSSLLMEKKETEIDLALEDYHKDIKAQQRARVLRNQLSKKMLEIEDKAGAENVEPKQLKRMFGLKYNDNFGPEHSDLQQKAYETSEKARKEAEEEVNKLMNQIEKLMQG